MPHHPLTVLSPSALPESNQAISGQRLAVSLGEEWGTRLPQPLYGVQLKTPSLLILSHGVERITSQRPHGWGTRLPQPLHGVQLKTPSLLVLSHGGERIAPHRTVRTGGSGGGAAVSDQPGGEGGNAIVTRRNELSSTAEARFPKQTIVFASGNNQLNSSRSNTSRSISRYSATLLRILLRVPTFNGLCLGIVI